jgi:FAD/FMN-containing dehydrogenase
VPSVPSGVLPDAWTSLRAGAAGRIITAADPEFRSVTDIYAARQKQTPAAVLQPVSDADVAHAIATTRAMGVPLAVCSGGHSYAGYSSCDGGLVLHLGQLQKIRVDQAARTVTVGAGALVGQIDEATAAHGQATVLGQCGSVGVGGLATGGGLGYLMSRHGLAVDNLVRAKVVTADSRILVCDRENEPDLFWAIRGGGGNFGVVTEFTFRTHEVSTVLAGDLIFRTDDMPGLLEELADFCSTAPDELTIIAIIAPGPQREPLLIVQLCYAGDPARGQAALAAFRSSPRLILDQIRLQPYLTLQSGVPHTPPSLHFNRTGAFGQMTASIARDLTEIVQTAPDRYTLMFVHHHGAAISVPTEAMAFPLRSKGFSWGVTGRWTAEEDARPAIDWVLAAHARLRRYGSLAYVNTMDVEAADQVRAAYGPNFEKLSRLKRRFDPDNVFHRNQNILPAAT